MLENDKREFAQIMRATMITCRGEIPEASVMKIWWAALERFSLEQVSAALSQYCLRGKFPPMPADILEILDRMLPDGRPTADEAWALYPRSEYASSVITDEMAEAFKMAAPLLDSGDKIGARMAFKDAYNRIVEQNKLSGIAPTWLPSLGHDKDGREAALQDAVNRKLLKAEHAVKMLSPSDTAALIEHTGAKLQLEDKREVSTEQALSNIAKLREIICSSSIVKMAA